jgi:hypothetical protein
VAAFGLAGAAAQRQPLAITLERLPDGVVGRAYQARLQALPQPRAPRWTVIAGRLPQGLSLNARTGELRGVPERVEEARFTARVTDARRTAEAEFTLLIVPPLEFAPAELPKLVRGNPLDFHLQARGGKAPLRWRIAAGALPTGLELDPSSGRIAGTPTQKQQADFIIEVHDSAAPPQTGRRNFIVAVLPALEVRWIRQPVVAREEIGGSVSIINHSEDELDVTLIVVAVNEIGKAFALGYQRLNLAPQSEMPEIPFLSTLPRGQYTVHADVVGEMAVRGFIYRDRLQSGVLTIP